MDGKNKSSSKHYCLFNISPNIISYEFIPKQTNGKKDLRILLYLLCDLSQSQRTRNEGLLGSLAILNDDLLPRRRGRVDLFIQLCLMSLEGLSQSQKNSTCPDLPSRRGLMNSLCISWDLFPQDLLSDKDLFCLPCLLSKQRAIGSFQN